MTEPAAPGRLRSTGEVLARFLARIPFSDALALALIVTGALVGTVAGTASQTTLETWSAGMLTTFEAGRWWTPVTALLIPQDPVQLVVGVLGAILLLGVAERRMGTWRAILAFAVTGILGVLLGVGVQWVGSLAGEWWATGASLDLTLDPLTGVLGALITATAFMGPLWRRRFRVVTLAFVLIWALYEGDSANVYRLFAILIGYPLGALLARDPSALSLRRSSHGERRTLFAAVIAVTALGPVVAFLNDVPLTPFAFASYLFPDEPVEPATVLAQCATLRAAATDDCKQQLALVAGQGPGMLVLSFLPTVLLLLGAWGLLRGRRFAMWLVVAVNAAILLFARSSLDTTLTLFGDDDDFGLLEVGELIVWALAAAALPIVIVIVLLVNRREFPLRAPRIAARRFAWTTVPAFAVLAVAYFAVGLIHLGDFVPPANAGDLAIDTVKRFIPPHFAGGLDPVVIPDGGATAWLRQWAGPIAWLVFVVAAYLRMRRSAAPEALADERRFRELLRRGGGGTLGFMGTWPGNSYWFTAEQDAAVAYRVIGGIAITMSDPVCAPERAGATIRGFAEFCDRNSWTPVFYSFHDRYLPVFDELGWQRMSVGEETVVRLPGLDFQGKPWQKVRQALNRGIKEGHTTVWTTWDELPLASVAQIEAISEEWVAEKELPEMGFTLGGMAELKDRDVRIMLALDADGRIQGVTSWLPSWRGDGTVGGWTLDFMRRVDGSMNGIMEFLIASAAVKMRDDGADVLSLSGAPLAEKPVAPGEPEPDPTTMSRLLDFLARTLEPAYGFRSLFRFKAKFNPDYATILMAYPDPLELPAIGVAIGRAYLPELSGKESVALVRTLTTGKR